MTWIEVADSAIKIGFGALISGIVAYFMARQKHLHDLAKVYARRRQESFEQVVDEFTDIQMSIMNMASNISAFI